MQNVKTFMNCVIRFNTKNELLSSQMLCFICFRHTIINTGIQLQRGKWSHLAIAMDSLQGHLRVYSDGNMVYSNQTTLPLADIFSTGGDISIRAGTHTRLKDGFHLNI